MESGKNKAPARAFAAAFAASVSEALSTATGSPWPLEVTDSQEAPAKGAQPVQFRIQVEGALRGDCFVEFYEPRVAELIAKLGGDAEDGVEERCKALSPTMNSAMAALSEALAAQYGELSLKAECVSGLAFRGMFVVALGAPEDQESAAVLVYFDGELLDALTSAGASGDQSEGAKGGIHPANLKLVMDVELNVSLRFGQRQLPLREVLELSSGSVIELDRMVDEPVELLLDGKLVARGEAVIVDGNYGLRVTEIPQAMETHFLR
jgi:flagellar motor switch protein FliN